MDVQEFKELISLGREQRGVEFKRAGSRKDKHLLAKVVRVVLSMANRRNGGLVIIGVEEDSNGTPIPSGISEEELETWNYDNFSDSLARYADPSVSFDLEIAEYDNKKFLAIKVQEFEDIPVLCKSNYADVLREGACYVRSRRKPETIEIPTQADMRDLLQLAIEKGVRKFVSQARTARLDFVSSSIVTDTELFNQQLSRLFDEENLSATLRKIYSRGFWTVVIRPRNFNKERVSDISSLYPLLERTVVKLRGWDFPHLDYHNPTHIDVDWIAEEFDWEHHISSWFFFQSGQFIHVSGMSLDWRDQSTFWPADDKWKPGTLLGIGDTIFRFTEIIEFAARLALSDAGNEQMHIHVTAGNLKGRFLYMDGRGMWIDHYKPASIKEFSQSKDFTKSDLVARPREIALELSSELFKRFGWNTTVESLQNLQEEIVRR